MKHRFCFTALLLTLCFYSYAQQNDAHINLSVIATPSGSTRNGDYHRLNDGTLPVNRTGPQRPGNRPAPQYQPKQWVQYDWKQPVSTKEVAVYWHNANGYFKLPKAYRLQYWNGSDFVNVHNTSEYGLANDQLNYITFDEVKTSKLRLEVDSTDRVVTPLQEWLVYQSKATDEYPPVVIAGVDRDVMVGGKTYLSGVIKSVTPVQNTAWVKESGPGAVTFSNASLKDGTATFSQPGTYSLKLTAANGGLNASSSFIVKVTPPPATKRLDVVYTTRPR
jgi:hypothetical protein